MIFRSLCRRLRKPGVTAWCTSTLVVRFSVLSSPSFLCSPFGDEGVPAYPLDFLHCSFRLPTLPDPFSFGLSEGWGLPPKQSPIRKRGGRHPPPERAGRHSRRFLIGKAWDPGGPRLLQRGSSFGSIPPLRKSTGSPPLSSLPARSVRLADDAALGIRAPAATMSQNWHKLRRRGFTHRGNHMMVGRSRTRLLGGTVIDEICGW